VKQQQVFWFHVTMHHAMAVQKRQSTEEALEHSGGVPFTELPPLHDAVEKLFDRITAFGGGGGGGAMVAAEV
jgi:hypothetical protein